MTVFSYVENGQVLYRFNINLRSLKNPRIRIQRSKRGFTNRKEADKADRLSCLEVSSEIARLESQGTTWEEVLHRWEQFQTMYPSPKLSRSTVRDYISLMYQWTMPWMKRNASELSRGDGRVLINHMVEMEKLGKYQKKVKCAVNVIYCWGVDERLIGGSHISPMQGVDIDKRDPEKLPEILTLDQIQKLLREAMLRYNPWYPIWAVTVLTGCRNGEVLGLRKQDIELVSPEEALRQNNLPAANRNYGLIRLVRAWKNAEKKYGPLKGRCWRNVPVSSQLYKILMELKQKDFGSDEHGDYLLPRLNGWTSGEQAIYLRAFCNQIGIPSVRFHTLRACFATHLISKGIPSVTVMKICGWKELKTAERYIRLAGISERGATEVLDFTPNDQGVMEKVVSLYGFTK